MPNIPPALALFNGVLAALALSACGASESSPTSSANDTPANVQSASPHRASAPLQQTSSCRNCVVSEQIQGEQQQPQFVVIWRGVDGQVQERFDIDLPAGAFKDLQALQTDKMPRLNIADEKLKSSRLDTTREVFRNSEQSVIIYITVLRDDSDQIIDVRVNQLSMPLRHVKPGRL
ncbi:hypothetical protein [Idiomarina xiamenensis]|uniref:Lipoprotein n=1 Tax=Idiomarina xiamenensis 10-D-4 TaxID=740709 RepID=K2L3R4_9GAMM|nr:hypothetical protein [Idiomarina xiamenensis]EKE84500.1 hypothetical protein A10D4_05512 [Idiomarina xiamenensis 10-D-4]